MSARFRFGAFEIDADRRELHRGGEPVEVQPKILDVIVHLVRHRDRVVSRDELLDALWGDVAVSEGVLTTAIHAARSALDDTAARGWAIKTVARHGYRFVAPVTGGAADADARSGSSGATAAVERATAPSDASTDEPFVGRERCVGRIEAAVAAAVAGRGRVLVVSGESGIGKTRLLDEMVSRAPEWGVRALFASCDVREGAPAYAPWTDIAAGLLDAADPVEAAADLGAGASDLAQLLPAVRALCPDLPEPPRLQSGTSRFRLFESIRTFFAHASGRRPLLVMLDDLQAADHASLRLLAHLARELRHLPILVVATLREHAGPLDPVLEETLAEIARQFPGQRIQLEGLDAAEIAALVSHLTGARPPRALVETIHDRSEGNPFFVREIVGVLDAPPLAPPEGPTAAGEAAWATRVPPGVRDVILGRLHRQSEAGQRLLLAAAVLGRTFRLGILARMLDTEPAALAAPVAEACASGFLREDPADADLYMFSHGLMHETLYDAAGSAERKRLHGRAGEVLESLAGPAADASPAALARHFLRAGDDAALARAIEYAVRAAEQAHAVHAHDEAAKLYGMALDALERMQRPDEARRCDLLIALGAAQLGARLGDPRGRESLLRAADIARQLGEPFQLARAALAVSATALQSGPRDPEITRILEAALDAIGENEDVLRARLMANLAFQLHSADNRDRSVALCEDALALARKSGDPEAVCEALNIRCALLSGPAHASTRLRDADEILAVGADAALSELALFGYRWRLLTMLELGDLERADAELSAYDTAVDRDRVWSGRWYGLTLRAARALAEARFDAAERMVIESFAHRRDETTPLIIGTFATQLFWLRREQGRLDELGHLHRHDSSHIVFRALLALLDAETGQSEAARVRLREAVPGELAGLPHDFTYLYVLSALAETARALDDCEAAEPLYEALAPHAGRYAILFMGAVQLGSTSRPLGQLAAVLGDTARAEAHFADALEANRRIGAHLWVARTRLDQGALLAGTGDARRAREILLPCLAEAHERGMAVIARRAAALLDRLPPA